MKRRSFLQTGVLGTLAGSISWPLATIGNIYQEPGTVKEESKNIRVAGQYDVIVSGAGPAGVMAAIQSGRNGAKTLLLEVRGCLGGVWTAGLLTWILDQANKSGLMRELELRLEKMGAKCPVDTGDVLSYDVEKMKLLLENMCMEANVDLLLHSRVAHVIKDKKNHLTHVITESKSGREAWGGKLFIDATGDGDLAALSGCGYDFGDQKNGGSFQPMSLLAIISGIQYEEIKQFSHGRGEGGSKKRLLAEIVRSGILPSYRSPSLFPIDKDLFMVMVNHEYGFSGLNAVDVTKATLHSRQEVHKIINGLKSLQGPWKNVRIVATSEHIGVREGRRIHGLYTVTAEDILNGVHHEDAVCRVTFPVDVHSVHKTGEAGNVAYNQGIKAKPYDIPLRSLISKDVNNLMMAGRCISGDFIAHSSYRVTGNAVPMGEAAGKVAALAAAKNKLPKDIDYKSI